MELNKCIDRIDHWCPAPADVLKLEDDAFYGFDYKKANCTQANFDWEVLG